MVTKIKDIKTKNEGIITGKILSDTEKTAKNGNKYLEGIISDKSGEIKFKIFNENEIKKFKNMLKKEFNINKQILKKISKFKGYYQEKFKTFIVEKVLEPNENEILENIYKEEKDISNILKLYENKKFKNKLFEYIYTKLILKNIDTIKEFPNTKYKSFNWKGGLLERNYLLYKQIKSTVKNLQELDKNIDNELLEFVSLIKDIPAKLISLKKENYEEYKLNNIGKLLTKEYITSYMIHKLSEEFLEELENSIIKIKKSQNNIIANWLEQKNKLNKKIDKIKKEKKEYEDLYKFFNNLNIQIDNIDKDKIVENLKKYFLLIKNENIKNENIKINKNEIEINNNIIKINDFIDNIINKGKELANIIDTTEKTLENITIDKDKEYSELEKLINNTKKELKKYDEDFLKILHIIESSGYYFSENENLFPKFIEAQIFANIVFAFTNTTFFIQEYNKLKQNSENNENIFSNKFGRYLY